MNKVTARGIKTPLIKTGQNLAEIVVNSLLADADQENYQLHDGDVIGITEAVVSIAYNNFATLDEIAADINNKFKGNALGVVFPIFSRNRFSMLLKAFARAKKELYLLMSYPNDEVGNPILKVEKLKEIKEDVFDEKVYFKHFKDYLHPWTKMNIVDYYLKIMKEEKAKGKIIFSNNALDILNYTDQVLISNVHEREKTRNLFPKQTNIYTLANILTKSINGSGYNSEYGLLGSNYFTREKVKLFPSHNEDLLTTIQTLIYQKRKVHVEVFIYGDGAFKDPLTGIWELCDPVVSPSYTKTLLGSKAELKLKYLAFNELKDLDESEFKKALLERKKLNTLQDSLGTTPRRTLDLLGTLADLVSGSGERQTPVVLIQNFLK